MSKATDKFEYVMKEFAAGKLKSSSGEVVTDRQQALAIAYSESGLKKSIMLNLSKYSEGSTGDVHNPNEGSTDDEYDPGEGSTGNIVRDKPVRKAILIKSKYTKRWKGKDGKWRYEYAERNTTNVKDAKENAIKIRNAAEKDGYEIEKSSFSHTSFGNSYYLTVKKDDIEVVARISDHGTGMLRLGDYDLHADIRDSPESVLSKINNSYIKVKERHKKRSRELTNKKANVDKKINDIAKMVVSGKISKTALRKKSKDQLAKITGWWDTKDYADKILSAASNMGKDRKSFVRVGKSMMKRIAAVSGGNVENTRLVTYAQLKRLADPPAEYDRRYKLHGHRRIHGMDIAIENAAGSTRSGKNSDGTPWQTTMKYDYGRIVGVKGCDDEGLDAYIGPDEGSDQVFVIHQNDPVTGRFGENKVFFYMPSREAAIEGYLSQYDSPDFYGGISEYKIGEFKERIKNGNRDWLYRSPILLDQTRKSVRIMVRAKRRLP